MSIQYLQASVFGVLMAWATGVALANDEANKPRAAAGASRPAAATPATKPSADKSIAAAARRAGIAHCAQLSDKVTRYLIGDSKSAGILFAPPKEANDRIASASIEVESAQSLAYASATYAPYGDAGCGVAYDAITYLKESCAAFAAKNLKGMKSLGALGTKIAMFEGGPQLRIYLMPAGTGCVQIKKEVLY
jgi:hypothetical protein